MSTNLSLSSRRLCTALTDTSVNYEGISSLLDAMMKSFGISYFLKPSNHPSFLKGRAASILAKGKEIGFIGEIHPRVLQSWGLEKPVVALETSIGFLLK